MVAPVAEHRVRAINPDPLNGVAAQVAHLDKLALDQFTGPLVVVQAATKAEYQQATEAAALMVAVMGIKWATLAELVAAAEFPLGLLEIKVAFMVGAGAVAFGVTVVQLATVALVQMAL